MTSSLLVFGPFAMITALLFCGGWDLPWWGWTLFVAGLLVFGAAAASLGTNNFTVMPDPRKGNSLSKRGIYAVIRRPMYTAVLLCGAGVALGAPSIFRTIALIICSIVLLIEIRYEEMQLTLRHPAYPMFTKGVARLVPFV